jgi:hypothetical protein
MTLPYERTNAVLRAHGFLRKLISPYEGYKRIPSEVRKEALSILRHYPWPCEMEREESELFSPTPEAYRQSCNRSSTSAS